VDLTLRNASGASVATGTLNQSVAAGNTSSFDITTGAISSPSLWSPTSPTLYSLQTLVSVAGTVIDSMIEQVGLRFYSWSAGTPGGLSINGARTELKGVCLGQWMGWIENAVPDSRFAKQVAMIKGMGANSIRCSHYPRAEAFYHACDSVGMLVLCEVPNWGVNGGFANLTTFWNRIYSCDSEMVLDGYNHPCIWGWSLFNEPSETNLGTDFANESSIVHALDPVAGSGRVTLISNYAGNVMYPLDIYGLNYSTSTNTTIPVVNTEDYQNWFRTFFRGNAMDMDVSSSSEAAKELNQMAGDWSTSDKCGGAHFWCFMDYCSFRNQTGREGLVDRLWIPKNVYYMFKSTFGGGATDYWTNGTPTKIDLAADLTTLKADGSDISQIVATLRDGSNKCVQTATNITFTATPAGCVAALYPGDSTAKTSGNPVTMPVEGGRAGVLLRTTTTSGNITVTASGGGFTQTVQLTSQQVSENYYTGAVPVAAQLRQVNANMRRLSMTSGARGYFFRCPPENSGYLRIVNMQGKTVFYRAAKKGETLFVKRTLVGSGVFYATWEDGATRVLSRMTMVN
jgi:hypothetical protein